MHVYNNFCSIFNGLDKVCNLINKWEKTNKINDVDFLVSLIKKGRFPSFDPPVVVDQNRMEYKQRFTFKTSDRLRESKRIEGRMRTKWEESIHSNLTLMKETLNHFYGDSWSFTIIPTNNIPSPQVSNFVCMSHVTHVEKDENLNSIYHFPITSSISIVFDLAIKIHFPKIKIRNSKESSHDIKNLFVFFTLDPAKDFIPFANLSGCRTEWSIEETFIGYQHSHLPYTEVQSSSHITQARFFCLGEGSIIEAFIRLRSKFNRKNFEILLMELETYIPWESLEGGPYVSMDNIKARGVANNSYMFENIPIYFSERDRAFPIKIPNIGTNSDSSYFYDKVCDYTDLIFIILSELEEYIAHSSYVVASEILLFDEELDTKIKEVLEKRCPFFYEKNLICYHPQSRERYLMKSDIESAATLDDRVNELLDKKYFINLRDKQFPMQITKKESKVEEIKFFFNPKIINNVKFRISKIIYYKVLREIFKRENQSFNARRIL